MPYRRRTRKPYRKRRTRRRRTYRRKRSGNVVMNRKGFPSTMITRMKFNDFDPNEVLSTGQYLYNYRLNSIFDPDLSSTGTQPTYFDTYATLYERYRIVGAKIVIKIQNLSAVVLKATLRAAPGDQTTPADTNYATQVEQLNQPLTSRMLSPVGSAGSKAYLKLYVPCHRVFGISKQSYLSEHGYAGLVTGNPAYQGILQLTVTDGGLLTNSDFCYDTNITYYTIFNRLKDLNVS